MRNTPQFVFEIYVKESHKIPALSSLLTTKEYNNLNNEDRKSMIEQLVGQFIEKQKVKK